MKLSATDQSMAETYKDADTISPTVFGVNPDPSELGCMAHSPDKSVRRLVSSHPLTDEKTISLLSKDEDWVVRFCALSHKNCTLDTFLSLSNDPILHIRCRVFSSPKASPELLEVGAKDPCPEVRICVVNHPLTRLETLARLERDKDWGVAQGAKARVNHRFKSLTI